METCPSVDIFLEKSVENNYHIFSNSNLPYNLNIVGWRDVIGKSNEFCDWLAVYWLTKHGWERRGWRVTTRPGIPWLLNPMRESGTAILCPGQYLQTYALGMFKGYTALKQVKEVKVYRDNNLDDKVDTDTMVIETGLFGIHIHRAGWMSKVVGLSSAGCQVFQSRAGFDKFIDICRLAERFYGNKFSYTLLEL